MAWGLGLLGFGVWGLGVRGLGCPIIQGLIVPLGFGIPCRDSRDYIASYKGYINPILGKPCRGTTLPLNPKPRNPCVMDATKRRPSACDMVFFTCSGRKKRLYRDSSWAGLGFGDQV